MDKVIEQLQSKLFHKAVNHIDAARSRVLRTVNHEMVKAYWLIGQDIVFEEQAGEHKAKYGEQIIRNLSKQLQERYGKGFSVTTLKDIRKFFLMNQLIINDPKSHALRGQLEMPNFSPNLSWTHYRTLMRVSRPAARLFYEQEAEQNNWSARELERQIGSLLFDRLNKSRDKRGMLEDVKKHQQVVSPADAIKDPYILEFLNLPESHKLTGSNLEQGLIDNLQDFLIELGKGFAFLERQKRLTIEGDHFYADLIFYHVVLKCYIVVDLKARPLTHGDISQIELYVNYFDQEIKLENDNPTLGLILCTDKNETMVKYLLGDNNNKIFTSQYQLHLPTEKQLQQQLEKEIHQIEHQAC